MIISASVRTDLPAFYSRWFLNRIREGYVLVRNPYNPSSVTRYLLNSDVVDCLFFCTKNPAPLLPHLQEIAAFPWMWHVTLTPYGKDMEPNVSDKHFIVEQFRKLSVAANRHNALLAGLTEKQPDTYGHHLPPEVKMLDAVQWRYDPICITERYTVDRHIKSFETMASLLEGYTHTCIISFVDIYKGVSRNFPTLTEVSDESQQLITEAFVEIGHLHDIAIKTCVENPSLAELGADCSGCATPEVISKAMGLSQKGLALIPPKRKFARAQCSFCALSGDIGAYSSCPHLCRYCYANHNEGQVRQNHAAHDPASPFIIGNTQPGDIIRDAKQESWIKPLGKPQPDLFCTNRPIFTDYP